MINNLKIITSFQTLLAFAKKESEAKIKYGEHSNEFIQAHEAHEQYRQLCLRADEMLLGCSRSKISAKY